MESAAKASKVLVMISSPFVGAASNAVTMLMCYLVLRKGYSCDSVVDMFSTAGIAAFPNPFVYIATPKLAALKPIDCARGLLIAREKGWYPDVAEWRALRVKYSATWVVPGLFLAMPDPVTIDDGFSRTSLISRSGELWQSIIIVIPHLVQISIRIRCRSLDHRQRLLRRCLRRKRAVKSV